MADPCAQLVVPRGIEVEKAATELLHPCAPLGCFCACFRRYAGFTRTFGKEPNRAAEDFAVCIGCSAHFLAGHWVAGEKSGLVGLVVVTGGMLAENSFHAADVGYELMWLQNTSELFQVFENAENRAAEQNQIALGGGCQRFFGNYVDRREAQCGRCLSRVAVPSDDRSAEAVLAQRHSHGASDQAGAENGDALDRHIYAIVLSTAEAITRNSCISLANCSGKSVCAPSETALSGFGCTSISKPSAPAATAARAIAGTLSRRPTPCDGSPSIGRCDSFLMTGIAEMSIVLRVYVSKVRMPRSQSMTS